MMEESIDGLAAVIKKKRVRLKEDEGSLHALRELFAALHITDYPSFEEDVPFSELLEAALKPKGIMKRRIVLGGRWWDRSSGPILATNLEGELVTLKPHLVTGYAYLNPATGKRERMNSRRTKQLQPDALCFYPALPAGKVTAKGLLRFALGAITRNDIAALTGMGLMITLFGMIVPFINKQLFDNVIPSGSFESVLPITAMLIGISVGTVLFEVSRNLLLARFITLVNLRLQNAVVARTFYLPAQFFRNYGTGELTSRMMSVTDLCQSLSDVILSTLLTFLFSMIYLVQLFQYAQTMFVPALFLLLATFLLLFLIFLSESRFGTTQLELNSKLTGTVYRLLAGIQKIKLAGAEKRAFAKWATSYRQSADHRYHPPLLKKLAIPLTTLMMVGGTALFYYLAASTEVTPANYIAFLSAFGMVNSAIISFSLTLPRFANIHPQIKMMKPILETEPETRYNAEKVTTLSGSIQLTNLSFRYAPDQPMVINGISLHIKPGEYVGIVGRSGGGKSTLMRLLLGFEAATRGSIFYDSYDLSKVDKQSLRRRIGTCLQNGKLFSGNILSNITVTAPWSTLEEAWRAAESAGIADDIKAMPMGMFTIVSENGGGLSGGQKQRILIARALINNPDILLFDEATSALDNIKQKEVTANLNRLGCTRVIVAHRLSTIRECDRIIVLDKGQIAEEGSYDELMALRGIFYDMNVRQL